MADAGILMQMKRLAFLVGDWDVALEIKPTPQGEWEKSAAHCRCEPILDGAALQQVFEGTMMGQPFLGRGFFCYNRITGRWQHNWIDNLAALISTYEGGLEEERLVLTGSEKSPEGEFRVRLIWFHITADHFEWVLETSVDSRTWMVVMKMTYTRKAPGKSVD